MTDMHVPQLSRRHVSKQNQPCFVQVMMVTEYMQGGDLGTALAHDDPKNRRLGWYNNGNQIALEIARALAYLHAQKVFTPFVSG